MRKICDVAHVFSATMDANKQRRQLEVCLLAFYALFVLVCYLASPDVLCSCVLFLFHDRWYVGGLQSALEELDLQVHVSLAFFIFFPFLFMVLQPAFIYLTSRFYFIFFCFAFAAWLVFEQIANYEDTYLRDSVFGNAVVGFTSTPQ